jgi:hypothetical protein
LTREGCATSSEDRACIAHLSAIPVAIKPLGQIPNEKICRTIQIDCEVKEKSCGSRGALSGRAFGNTKKPVQHTTTHNPLIQRRSLVVET